MSVSIIGDEIEYLWGNRPYYVKAFATHVLFEDNNEYYITEYERAWGWPYAALHFSTLDSLRERTINGSSIILFKHWKKTWGD